MEQANRLNQSIATLPTRQRVYAKLLPPGYKPKIDIVPSHSLSDTRTELVTRKNDAFRPQIGSDVRSAPDLSQTAPEKPGSRSYLSSSTSIQVMKRSRGMHKESGGYEPEFHCLPNGGLLEPNGLGPVLASLLLLCMLIASLGVPWVYATHSVVVPDDQGAGSGIGAASAASRMCSWMEMRGWSTFQCTKLVDSPKCTGFFNDFNCTNYNWRDALTQNGVSVGELGTVFDVAAVFLFLALCTGFALLILFIIRCTSRDHSGNTWWHIYLVGAGALFLFLALTVFSWSYSSAFKSTFSKLHGHSQGATLDYDQHTKECNSGPCASFWGSTQYASSPNQSRWGPAGWYFALFALMLHGPLAYWSLRDGDEYHDTSVLWTSTWQKGSKSQYDSLLTGKESLDMS